MSKTKEKKSKPGSLIMTSDLLSQSWKKYKQAWTKYVILVFLQIVFIVVVAVLFGTLVFVSLLDSIGLSLFMLIPVFILYVVVLLFALIFYLSMIYVFKDAGLSIGDSLKKAFKKLGSAILLSIVFGIIIGIGYLLFIIPGIIFTIWYVLAFYVLIYEDKGAIESLKRSKELVGGFGWSMFLKLIVLVLIQFFIGVLGIIPILGFFVNIISAFVLTPFWVVYLGLIYKDLVKIKSKNSKAVDDVDLWKKILASLFVLLCVVAFVGYIILMLFFFVFQTIPISIGDSIPTPISDILESETDDLDINVPEDINFDQGLDFESFLNDSDNDGLPDAMEDYYLTDPAIPDTDGDGINDGEEVEKGTNPLGD